MFITHSVEEAAYLADRIAITTPHPGKIKKIISVEKQRPREYVDEELIEVQKIVYSALGIKM